MPAEELVAVRSSMSLTGEQLAFARALVDAGRSSSVSAVLRPGVALLGHRMDAEEPETAALRELPARRRNGAFVGVEIDLCRGHCADLASGPRP